MKPDEIDRIIEEAAGRFPAREGDGSNVETIAGALLQDLRPVRPLAPAWVFTLSLTCLFAIFAVVSASILGLHGVHALSFTQIGWLFSGLLGTAMMAAVASAREMRPASGVRLGFRVPVAAIAVFLALFASLLTGYGTQHFVAEGIPCLVAGLSVALPTAAAAVWILRRGYVMDWSKAGTVAGTLAGLTGLGMLELHCPNLKAIHVMVWHVAVVMVSGAAGFAIGWLADSLRRKRMQ